MKSQKTICIWDGYFDNIMNLFEPTDKGWEGIALYYHLDTGWYDESPWELTDIKGTLTQFQALDKEKLTFENSKYLLEELCNLLQDAIVQKRKIWIARE